MGSIEIRKISITDLDTDAIVNAANDGLWAGSGVCGYIFAAAGHDLLQEACRKIGHCDTGSAVITPGFHSKAKYIIHAVGPVWQGGGHNEPKLLYSAYHKALELARENGCKTIGFPLLSAGIYGYPKPEAWKVALRSCTDFLNENPDHPIDIIFAVLDDKILKMGTETLQEMETVVPDTVVKDDWNTIDMPEQHDTFILHRSFSAEEMNALRRGHIPQEMEDKWFWYMEGDTLFAHRSWTGYCIYRIDFKNDGDHLVTVNRDRDQYGCTSTDEDLDKLNDLLDWWTEKNYDYYNEWLSETEKSLKGR